MQIYQLQSSLNQLQMNSKDYYRTIFEKDHHFDVKKCFLFHTNLTFQIT
jgi:hypothetical protein